MSSFGYIVGVIVLIAVVGAGYFYTANKTEAPEAITYDEASGTLPEGSVTEVDKDGFSDDGDTPNTGTSGNQNTPTQGSGTGTSGSQGSTGSGTTGGAQTNTTGTTETSTKPTPKTVVVNYSSSGYSPKTVEINVGDTVKWVSDGASMWTASANHPTHTILPEFDQDTTGNTYQFTFTKAGTWGYHNHVSANHTGTVVVK